MPMITLATPLIASTVAVAFMVTWAMEILRARVATDWIDETEE